ncbi:MAG: thioredoxin family protein [Calditrichaeota bacterium]|nr:thioredoxin family protein [Calditrichota bacterium]
MKNTLIIFLLFSTAVFAGETWVSSFDDAKLIAAKNDKKILLYFSGSDWCRPCILLKKKVFEKELFKKFADDNLVLALFDFPARDKNKPEPAQIAHNEKMAEIYNPEGNFPQVVLVTAEGKKISEFAGYGNETAVKYIAKLKEALAVK